MNRAVFLDRDGTLNEIIFDNIYQIHRPPWTIEEITLYSETIECLKRLQNHDFFLLLVSNQPDCVYNNVSYQQLRNIKYHLINLFILNKIYFKEYYYCFHGRYDKCECRKPLPYFLLKAAEDYHIDLKNSWMVGDSDKDVECGKNAGVKTILITNDEKYEGMEPDYKVNNIKEAVDLILSNEVKI